jgi:lipopolysaccharide export system permease protein
MLITRYLIKNLFFVTIFIVFTLTTVIWLTQSLKLLELVANSDAPPELFMKLVFLSLPKFLEIILPLSLVVAVLFTYNKMIMDNELIVMRACGIDQFSLAKPALILACALTIFLLSLTTYLTPKSTGELAILRQTVKAQYSAFLLREGVFNTFGNDLTVYLRRRDAAGDLYGLMIHDTREKDKPPITITAKRGHLAVEGGIPTLVVHDGMRQQMDEQTETITRLYFSQYTIEIKSLEGETAAHWHEAGERTLPELLNPDMSDARDRSRSTAFLAEANIRLATPFNAIGFTLTALCAILLGPFNRRGQNMKVMIGGALVVLAQALVLAFASLMKKNIMFAGAFYAAVFLPIPACLWLLRLPGEQMLMSVIRAWQRRQRERAA